MLPVELTLVLAATRNMGIGRAGTLPWTGLKKEMAYFARVTKRLPSGAQSPTLNAVIMGRKTWDSIPPRFRPLKGRLNIVISRSPPEPAAEAANAETDPVRVSSLEEAVEYVNSSAPGKVGRVFVIGGAQIYGAALQLEEAKRILLTSVVNDFECDTFFPLQLFESPRGGKWAKKSKHELDAWSGETVPEGVQEENGTQYEFQMWERVD
ncbi:dihydrofolate reductase-like domain-containing protein [Xylariales sp. AK1849]|nr:dihydrofolate reductase-like domain-containing protein [Xylariales sp. AK1849]